jgi:hypothetical protein
MATLIFVVRQLLLLGIRAFSSSSSFSSDAASGSSCSVDSSEPLAL